MFNLDEIQELVVHGRNRLDETGEYDINYYEKFLNENVSIIGKLIEKIINDIDKLQDVKLKEYIKSKCFTCLRTAYDKSKNEKPREKWKLHPNPSDSEGYFLDHPYAYFILKDYREKMHSFSSILKFMLLVYREFIKSEKKGNPDSYVLLHMFYNVKTACSMLGISCLDYKTICDLITNDFDEIKATHLGINVNKNVYSDDELRADINVYSLPYKFTAPNFSVDGPDSYEVFIDSDFTVDYKESYLQRLSKNIIR